MRVVGRKQELQEFTSSEVNPDQSIRKCSSAREPSDLTPEGWVGFRLVAVRGRNILDEQNRWKSTRHEKTPPHCV